MSSTAIELAEGFKPIGIEEATNLINEVADPILTDNMKYIYEYHGGYSKADPTNNIFYIAGFSYNEKYCIYTKMYDEPGAMTTYESVMDYVDALQACDYSIVNARPRPERPDAKPERPDADKCYQPPQNA